MLKMAFHRLYSLLPLIGMVLAPAATTDPGIRVKVSQTGIDYAASRILSEMGAQVEGVEIPPMSGSGDFDVGTVDYSFTNMQVTTFNSPDPSASVSPNDLMWNIDGAYISIHGDWAYEVHFLIPLHDHGDFDVDLIDISTRTDMVLETDGEGHMAMRVTNCNAAIGKITIKLNGSPFSWLYNFFDDLLSDNIRDVMQEGVCKAITQVIDVQVTEELATLQVREPIVSHFVIDYSLLRSPIIGDSFIQADLKGEVFWDNETQDAPIVPIPVPTGEKPNKMVNMWITSYVSDTLGYVAHQHHFINHTLDQDDLPDGQKYLLDTTCPDGKLCMGNVLVKLGEEFPGCSVEVPISTLAAPYVKTVSGKVDAVFTFDLPYYIVFPNNTRTEAFTTTTNVTFQIDPKISAEGKITAVVINSESEVTVTHSNIGTITDEQMNWAFATICNNIIIPILNEQVLDEGIDLPTLGSVKFVRTELTVQEEAILVSSDIMYDHVIKSKSVTPWENKVLRYQNKQITSANSVGQNKFRKL